MNSPPLGQQHQDEATRMTVRSAVAVVGCLCAVMALGTIFSIPLMLVLPVYFGAELLFAIIWYYRFLLLSYQPIKHRPLSHDPISAFERAMAHLQQFADIRHFLSIWFHGAKWEDIKRDNVADLLAYAFWYQTRDEIASEGRSHELEAMVQFIEHTWGIDIPPGRNAQLRWMCHLWEPMRCWYQPLGFYLFMELAGWLGSIAIRAAGFSERHWCGITYYTKNMPHSNSSSAAGACHAAVHSQGQMLAGADQQRGLNSSSSSGGQASASDVPFVLLHGLGMGLIPYISFMFNMAATGRPVIALQFKHVSMRWVLWVPTVDEVADVLVSILRRESVQHCCLVAHSYGTAVASRLLQQHPEKVVQTCMIDPVCFTMFMPNLLRNFLYESPNTGNRVGDFMMLCAARDLHVSATLSRRFFWTDVNLWEEQLPQQSLVVLSGKDILIAAPEVQAWLDLRTDAVVMYHPELRHAGFLLDIEYQQQILQRLLPLLDSKLEQQKQQDPSQPPSGGLQQLQQHDDAESGVQRDQQQHYNNMSSLYVQAPSHHHYQQQQGGLKNSGCNGSNSGFDIAAVATDAGWGVASAAGLHRVSSCGSHSTAFASICTTSNSNVVSVRNSFSLYDSSTAAAGGGSGNVAAAADELGSQLDLQHHSIQNSSSSNRSLRHSDSATESAGSSSSSKRLSIGRSNSSNSTSVACSEEEEQQQPHRFVGVDSDGCIIASLICPADLELQPAGDSGYFGRSFGAHVGDTCGDISTLSLPWAGCLVPNTSLACKCSNGSVVSSTAAAAERSSSLMSPFAYAEEADSLAEQQLDTEQQQQLQPLESWSGVVAASHNSRGNLEKGSVRSATSATTGLESPKTFLSGQSSQSWQDMAALTAAKDAAAAAQILLQPVQALQQLRHRQQQEKHARQLQQQQDSIQRLPKQVLVVPTPQKQQQCEVGAVQQVQRSVSSKRDGMLRRVEVLLHLRQHKRSERGAGSTLAGGATASLAL